MLFEQTKNNEIINCYTTYKYFIPSVSIELLLWHIIRDSVSTFVRFYLLTCPYSYHILCTYTYALYILIQMFHPLRRSYVFIVVDPLVYHIIIIIITDTTEPWPSNSLNIIIIIKTLRTRIRTHVLGGLFPAYPPFWLIAINV